MLNRTVALFTSGLTNTLDLVSDATYGLQRAL